MSSAKFKIGSSVFAAGGYDIAAGASVNLQLEDQPATDVTSCVYSVGTRSHGAPDPTFASAGVASPPGAAVAFTAPGSGIHSYEIRCVTNGGAAVKRPDGTDDYSVNNKSRIISIRGTASLQRKMVPAESIQYSPESWTVTQNEMVDAMEGVMLSGGGAILQAVDQKMATDGSDDFESDAGGAYLILVSKAITIGGSGARRIRARVDVAYHTDDVVFRSTLAIEQTSEAGSVVLVERPLPFSGTVSSASSMPKSIGATTGALAAGSYTIRVKIKVVDSPGSNKLYCKPFANGADREGAWLWLEELA
jgi:hypothetical protein